MHKVLLEPHYYYVHVRCSLTQYFCIVETPSELDLKLALSTVTDWFELGELLGLPYDLLEEIQIDLAPYGTKRQRSKLVHSWLQRDPAASWSKLCGALERMGENTAAQDIRTKHMAGELYSCVWNPVLRGHDGLRGSL